MKKKFVYFLIGALLTGLVLVVFQITQASPGIPNPGHALSCHIVTIQETFSGWNTITVECDSGTMTGGGCQTGPGINTWEGSYPYENSWRCHINNAEAAWTNAWVVCCEAI